MDIIILNKVIGKCKQNDRASQEMLYRHYFPVIYQAVKKMVVDEHDMVSIINYGFLKVFQSITNYNPEIGVFDVWLYTVIADVVNDHINNGKKVSAPVK